MQLYEQPHSVTETIRNLCYPCRQTLSKLISEQGYRPNCNPPIEGNGCPATDMRAALSRLMAKRAVEAEASITRPIA